MKILCTSDTHGNTEKLKEVVKSVEGIDILLHAGDHIGDVDAIDQSEFDVFKVKGNCDRGVKGKSKEVITMEDKKILLTHGHQYEIKYGLQKLSYQAAEVEADIVVFGHTHRSLSLNEEGILYFNPGSITYPRDDSASCGILEIKDGKVEGELKRL
ncbi:metallophosphoesterase family protein [Acetohalobium arabaticum]|uniref:Phosphoesterase n=1 Tax=Acetohalobium arabaticum (strain ATCC 49924 / DSM 5501 / Z-7288) TaxID=574087 RepID=D9QUY4_ACEAZ|nr:metallophosphoesterase [Acetohalobium arabaticum]ADL12043.1 phosphodiesterase, MJ0936 family [Acetohalobium arabaticum DSM 5501]